MYAIIFLALTAAQGPEPAPASIRLNVPEDATVYFDGAPTKQGGAVRLFHTPPLARAGAYEIRVQLGDRTATENLTVAPGGTAEASLLFETWAPAIPRDRRLLRFLPARFTQRIAVTNDRDTITPVPRAGLEAKWQVPGGMVNVHGWRSTLYKHVPAGGSQWVGNIAVWNGSNFQNNRGHIRSYPDGTEFHDVLTNTKTGKVFEHRVAEKTEGEWYRYVLFRDRKQQPEGYQRLASKACAACHAEAGTGGYATGLVPGGDTVLSDPLPIE